MESPDYVNRKRHHRDDRPGIRSVNLSSRQLLYSDGKQGKARPRCQREPGIHAQNPREIGNPQHGQRRVQETPNGGKMRVVKSLNDGPRTGLDPEWETIENIEGEPEPPRDPLNPQFRVKVNEVDIPVLRPEIHHREVIGRAVPRKIRLEPHLHGHEEQHQRGHARDGNRQTFARL